MRTLLLLVPVFWLSCSRSAPPYSPKEALKTFRIEPGFRIEPFLSEPDIRSPVAMEVDESGRIYVVEDPGYPLNTEGKVGRVILFTNGRRTVFAEQLTMPTGVMRWKKGILVTDAPNVLYFEDTDGDGKADVRQVVLTGFAFSNPQHTVNNPVYGLDNWIYLAHEGPATAIIFADKFGDRGSDIRFPDRPDGPKLPQARRMVRFRPDMHELEYLSTSSQFGHSFDNWGHQFTVSNEDHIRQEVIAAAYVNRNPELPLGTAMAQISDHRPAAEVYPITQHPRVEMLSGVGAFTSACAVTVYLGGAFQMPLFSLTNEPAQNLVHRDLLTPSGAVYLARRARERAEFLASSDPWFRPVNLYVGPDGAIYLLDYYRKVIEHPEWMATNTHKSPDLYQGEDRGRIWRITPEAGLAKFGELHIDDLVSRLASPNLWWRRTAQRLLIDRQSPPEPVAKLFETSQSAVGRLHALWTLDGLHKLDSSLIAKALADPEPGVRENAIQLAESRPELAPKLLALENDPDARVRFQLLCTLGGIRTPDSRAAQQRLLARNIDDRWMQVAALSASSDRAPELFREAGAFTSTQTEQRAAFFRQVAAVIGARRKPAEISAVLQKLAAGGAGWWRAASLNGLAQGLGRRHISEDAGQQYLAKMFDDPEVRHAALGVLTATGLPRNAGSLLARAEATASKPDADPALRADSISLLALADPAPHRDLFQHLIDPKQPEPVEAAAVRAFGHVPGPEPATFLIEHWRSFTPTVRGEAADAMFLEPERPKMLVAAIQNGAVQPWTLAFRHKRQLVMSRDAGLRETARALLEEKAGNREAVLKRYQAALSMKGDTARGRQVFERVCSKCHKLNGIGHDVGPDLATIRNRPPDLILPEIIMPSRSIAQGYETYVVNTKSSGIIDGVIGPQTSSTITLRHEDGKEDVIRREDIQEIHMTNLSAMPEDLDKQVSVEQMADLLRYLK